MGLRAIRTPQWRYVGLATLFAATLTALVSVGGVGVYGAPVLLVLQYLAARSSRGMAGRVLWSLVAGATAAEGAWGITYLTLGESQPWIWLVPTFVALGGAALIYSRSAVAPAHASTDAAAKLGRGLQHAAARMGLGPGQKST